MTCYFDAWCALSREAQATWVLAIFSVLGFFTALGIAVGQFRSARSIAKASVRPRLNFATRIQDDVVRLSLENNGLGPAINKEVDLFLDGKKLPDASYRTLEGTFRALDLVVLKPEGATLCAGQSLRGGASEVVFKFGLVKDRHFSYEDLERELLRITYVVRYLSLYGEEFVCTSGLPGQPILVALDSPADPRAPPR